MTLKQTNVRLDEAFIKEVKKVCLELDITFQEAVKEGLQLWLEKKKADARSHPHS
jgi:hypothetical protein